MCPVRQRCPERLDLEADTHFVEPAMHDVGEHVDADVERDRRDEEWLVALEGFARATGDRVGENLALPGHFPPLEIGPSAEDAGSAREELILAALAVVLAQQF